MVAVLVRQDPLLVVLLGPTASGKTALSLTLAERFNGESVSCDSVAVYRGMEIGTAKPSPAERARVPHHLIDIYAPDEHSTAGDYARRAREVAKAEAQPKPPAQPLPSNARSQIQAPAPEAPKPNFRTGTSTPGQQIQQMARNAARSGQYGGDMGANAPSDHPGEQGAVNILSDTMGVDFGPYIQRVIYDTKKAWYPMIPEVARPPLNKQGKVGIRFKILPDGSIAPGSMHLELPSGDVSLDKAAWGAINYAGYPPLPKDFKGPYLELRFIFLYNIEPGLE